MEQILGIPPQGILLDFQADVQSPMGIGYERCLDFRKEAHRHERMVICAARGATRAEIIDEQSGEKYVNSIDFVIVHPPGFYHSVKSLTSIFEDLALFPSQDLLQSVGEKAGYCERQIEIFTSKCFQVKRSLWLCQLLEQYFTRRVLQKIPPRELANLEEELLREIMVLCVGHPQKQLKAKKDEIAYGPFKKAVEMMESNLFANLSVEEVARASGLSESSLLRLFKKQVKQSPKDYVRRRRLEEADRLLRNSRYSVLEIATLVGYENASSFSRAFRQHFGKAPRCQKP